MDVGLILKRREAIERQVEGLMSEVAVLRSELEELNIAERVMLRLAGVPEDSSELPPKLHGIEAGQVLTIREMIKSALMDARQRGMPGRTPDQIRKFISATFHRDLGQQINTTASRMWRDVKEIHKDETTGLFSMPEKEKPVDEKSLAGTSTGLFSNPAEGREAGPGGGA